MVEIAENNTFSDPVVTKEVFLTNTHTETSLVDNKTYYLRVASKNLGGLAPWSNVVKFYTGLATNVKKIETSVVQLKCYPNPAGDKLTIEYRINRPVELKISIVDQAGKVFKSVSEKTLSKGDYNLELDVSGLSTGVWFIEVESSEREVIKFIKK